MVTIAESKATTYQPPSADVHNAVCAEFIDEGMKTRPFDGKEKHQGCLVFQVEECDDTGERKQARLWFNMTLGTEKFPSKIREVVESWTDRALTPDELEGFDPEGLVAKPCRLVIKHKERSDGGMAARVESVLKPNGIELEPRGYVSVAER